MKCLLLTVALFLVPSIVYADHDTQVVGTWRVRSIVTSQGVEFPSNAFLRFDADGSYKYTGTNKGYEEGSWETSTEILLEMQEYGRSKDSFLYGVSNGTLTLIKGSLKIILSR
jgi:hypothetical protein